MDHGQDFLVAVATVLCTAAVTTVLFQKLRQPIVFGYVIAGLIIGPHVPIPLVADEQTVQTLSELGVILLMFSLGLDFSLSKLRRVGPAPGITAIIECSFMIWLGFVVGRTLGWTTSESLFTGAVVGISSTTIIAKAFDESGVVGKLRDVVVGILIVEDLIAILLMATLTALSSARGLSAGELVLSTARLSGFLAALIAVGLLIVPRAIRLINRLDTPETTLVASIGICFAMALLAHEFGYSVALGAFLAGSLVAESGEEQKVGYLVAPVRDMFAAVFFVSVGMRIEPGLIAQHWPAVLALTAVVVSGKVFSVTLGAMLTGNTTRTSVQAAMGLAQIGEFSFIIAALGVSLNVARDFIFPVAVAVSAITTLTTPWLIRASGPTANFVERKLPRPIQTFTALYGSWLDQLRAPSQARRAPRPVRRLVRLLLLDALVLTCLVIGAAVFRDEVALIIEARVGLEARMARYAVIGAAGVLSLPFGYGIVIIARRLGLILAESALPHRPSGEVDLAAAPRRALVVTIQLAIVILLGAPIVAVTQPFLSGFGGGVTLLVVLALLGVAFWRSATNLQGHVRAGAQVIAEALAAQAQARVSDDTHALERVHHLLPGLGAPVPFTLHATSPAVGKTLAEINLRGMTGATVLAISRGEGGLLIPTARETLRSGDVLALAGTEDALAAARALLTAP
jgi:monovalent cation:H+ antiporter-2, CPA2 family